MATNARTVQIQLVENAVRTLVKDCTVALETPQPKKLKEAISRYKQEKGVQGRLLFSVDAHGFAPNGEIMYKLDITLIKE